MRSLLIIGALFAVSVVYAADAPEIELTLGQVREVQMALSTIEKNGNVSVPTCLGDVKPPCIPPAISHAIADDIFALATHVQFHGSQVHKLIGEASNGTGVVVPGSPEEARANYRLFDLNDQKVKVRLQPIDIHGLEASGVQLPPTIKAVLSPITK